MENHASVTGWQKLFFKSELFSCLPKVDHLITLMQRAYCETRASLKNRGGHVKISFTLQK